jgi:hypothetical protein
MTTPSLCPKAYRPVVTKAVLTIILTCAWASSASATDYGAVASGNWSTASTWGGSVPTSSDNAFIGSNNYPTGAATTATLTLSQNVIINNVYLGNFSSGTGTLNLSNFTLNANAINIGYTSPGALTRGTGTFSTNFLGVNYGGSLAFASGDSSSSFTLAGASSATTAAKGNISGGVEVNTGSSLTLGDNLNVTGNINLQDSGSILNAQGHNLNAGNQITIGWFGSTVVSLLNRGTINTANLYVGHQDFTLNSTDTVGAFSLMNGNATIASGSNLNTFNLYFGTGPLIAGVSVGNLSLFNGAHSSTATTANITFIASVTGGSTLTLGANLNVGNSVNLQDAGSTLDAQGYSITAPSAITIGWNGGAAVNLLNRGILSTSRLFVGYQDFTLNTTDMVSNFSLTTGIATIASGITLNSFTLNNGSGPLVTGVAVGQLILSNGASSSTVATSNITVSVDIYTGSTLALGANLNVSGYVNLQDSGSILNAQNHNIKAGSQVLIGWNGGTAVSLLNRGTITATDLLVGYQNFTLNTTDMVSNYYQQVGNATIVSGVTLNSFNLYNGMGPLVAGVAVGNLNLSNGATSSTTTTANVTGNVNVYSGSTLALGANLSVSGNVNIQDSGSTLDAQGHKIIAGAQVLIGWNGGVVSLLNRGTISAIDLLVSNQSFILNATDIISNYYQQNGNATIATGITLNSFNLYNGTGPLVAGVAVGNLNLHNGAISSTATTANVTGNINVYNGSTLTLGANLNVTGSVNVQDSGSVLNAQNHNIAAGNQVLIGWNGGVVSLLNRGIISATDLLVANQSFTLNATDSVINYYQGNGNATIASGVNLNSFNLSNGIGPLVAGVAVGNLNLSSGATSSTATAANVTGSVNVSGGSTLTLGANLTLAGNLNLQDNGTNINAQGNNITANQMTVGWFGGNATITNDGALTAAVWFQANNTIVLHNGNDSFGSLNISGNAVLRVASGQISGLTVTGTPSNSVAIGAGSKLSLDTDGNLPGWFFRWAGDHVADINSMIAGNLIALNSTNGGSYAVNKLFDGYTYVAAPTYAMFWTGTYTGAWNRLVGGTTNWSSSQNLTGDTGATPSVWTNVIFSINTTATNPTTTLGADVTISSLTVAPPNSGSSAAITIAGNKLTINGQNAFGNAPANGITLISGVAGLTVGSNVALGGSQTWINFSTGQLTINGGTITGSGMNLIVDGSGNTAISSAIQTGTGTLTKNGTGTLVLTGASSYTGATTVNTGGITGSGTITSNVTVVGGGTLVAGTSISTRQWNTGSVTFGPQVSNANSVYGVRLFGTGATDISLLNVAGTAAIDPTSRISLNLGGIDAATFRGIAGSSRTYTVLQATGAVGNFTTSNLDLVNNTGGFLTSEWSIKSNPTPGTVQVLFTAAIPEPGALLGLGAVGLALAGRNRRKHRNA